jgi:predicted dehydrogenase
LDQHFRLTAVCDSQGGYANEVAQEYGLAPWAAFTSAEALLASGGFDAVLLLTSGSHATLALDALAAKLPVFCEKPIAHTLVEAQEVADFGGRLMLGYMKQHDPAVSALLSTLEPSTIRHIDISVLHPPKRLSATAWTPEPTLPVPRHGDRARWEFRVLQDSVCHELALVRLLSGAPELAVDFAASWGAEPAGGTDRSDRAELQNRARRPDDEDTLGSLEFGGPLPQGGRYTIRWHHLPEYPEFREAVYVHHGHGSQRLSFGDPYLFDRDGSGFERELLAFHALVTEGTPPLSGAAEGVADIRTALRVLDRLDPLP